MIFQQLEGELLVKCEAVCRQWPDILKSETPWKRLFDRQVACSPLWRRAQKKLESNSLTLRLEEYQDICKDILQMECNWRTGNLTKFTYKVNRCDHFILTIGEDYVAWDFRPFENFGSHEGFALLDTESMKITKVTLCGWYELVNGMLVRWDYTDTGRCMVHIWNPKINWLINEEEKGFNARQICCGNELMACHSTCLNGGERIEVWKMGNPPTLLRTRTFEDRKFFISNVDERFIVAVNQSSHETHKKAVTLHFISTETLEVFTSLSAMNYECYLYERSDIPSNSVSTLMNFECVYSHGLLFQYRGTGIVRILDVATGNNVNDVRIPFQSKDKKFIKLLDTWVSSNSKVIVIGWKYSKNPHRRVSHLSVYDLEAVKKANSDPGTHLLYTLQFQFDIHSFVMNESEIAFSGSKSTLDWYVTVLKFANFSFAEQKPSDLKENPQDNKDSKEKIVKMKMKKIISDCVNFDEGEKLEACERLGEIKKKKKKKKKKHVKIVKNMKKLKIKVFV